MNNWANFIFTTLLDLSKRRCRVGGEIYTSKIMNILIISNCPLEINQGSGYVICGFAQGMQTRGHLVDIYGPEKFIIARRINRLKRLRLFIGYTLTAISEAWNGRKEYDIIELWGGVGWLACLILTKIKLGNYKVISRSNGIEPHYRKRSLLKTKINSFEKILGIINNITDWIGFNNADLLTVVSKYDEEFLLNSSYQGKARILVLENPLPDNWLLQTKRTTDKVFRIGFVGSWIERKGSEQLSDIINSLYQIGSTCEWIIAGVGEDGKKDIIGKTGISAEKIYEQVGRENLKSLYNDMTILLCLSSYESFGMVCSEAMACGCILVSTNVGFANGLINNIEYILVDRDRTDEVATKLRDIEKRTNEYKSIGINGQIRVQQLTWRNIVEALEKHYINLISQ